MSLQDMKRQIQSVDNTAKMTGAMQTISAVKLSRARERLDKIRPYTDNMDQMMRDIARAGGDNELLVGREEVRNVAVCTVTSDRGLAGPFNAQVLRRTMQFRQEQDADIVQVVTGRKAVEFFRFGRISLEEAYVGFSDGPTYEKAREIGRHLTQLFEDEEADEVHLVYNQFQSALVQHATVVQLLPVGSSAGEEDDDEEEEDEGGSPFEFIPGPNDPTFQSTHPHGVRLDVTNLIWDGFMFQSTHPHGVRPIPPEDSYPDHLFQSTHPHGVRPGSSVGSPCS